MHSYVSVIPRFPVEIQEHVVDSLARPMLLIAAQVSKTWYSLVMPKFYSTVELTSRKKYDLLVAQLRTSPRVKRWLLTTREVIITARDSSQFAAQRYTSFMDVFPFVFATALPSLRRLELHHGLELLAHPSFVLALRGFRTVTSLSLAHSKFDDVASMHRIVSAFSRMETLTLTAIATKHLNEVSSWARGRGRLPRLKTLQLMYMNEKTLLIFIPWLIDSGICTSLQNLMIALESHLGRVYNTGSECGRQISRLLEVCGPALTAFDEVAGYMKSRGKFCHEDDGHAHEGIALPGYPHCNLSHNTELISLRLYLHVNLEFDATLFNRPSSEDTRQRWLSAAKMLREDLSTVRSHRLEHLTIHLSVTLSGIFGAPDSRVFPQRFFTSHTESALHDAMARPYFDALKRVDVVLNIQYNDVMRIVWEKYVPRAVEPVVHDMFRPWINRDTLEYSQALRCYRSRATFFTSRR